MFSTSSGIIPLNESSEALLMLSLGESISPEASNTFENLAVYLNSLLIK